MLSLASFVLFIFLRRNFKATLSSVWKMSLRENSYTLWMYPIYDKHRAKYKNYWLHLGCYYCCWSAVVHIHYVSCLTCRWRDRAKAQRRSMNDVSVATVELPARQPPRPGHASTAVSRRRRCPTHHQAWPLQWRWSWPSENGLRQPTLSKVNFNVAYVTPREQPTPTERTLFKTRRSSPKIISNHFSESFYVMLVRTAVQSKHIPS